MPIFKSKFHPTGQPPAPPTPAVLAQIGPVVPIQIEVPQALNKQLTAAGQPVPAPITGYALIDTGATMSAVDTSVIQKLGVNPVGLASVQTAGGPQQQSLYPIRLIVQGVGLVLDAAQVTGSPLGMNLGGLVIIALIGRDFLQAMLMFYDGPAGEFTVAF